MLLVVGADRSVNAAIDVVAVSAAGECRAVFRPAAPPAQDAADCLLGYAELDQLVVCADRQRDRGIGIERFWCQFAKQSEVGHPGFDTQVIPGALASSPGRPVGRSGGPPIESVLRR